MYCNGGLQVRAFFWEFGQGVHITGRGTGRACGSKSQAFGDEGVFWEVQGGLHKNCRDLRCFGECIVVLRGVYDGVESIPTVPYELS